MRATPFKHLSLALAFFVPMLLAPWVAPCSAQPLNQQWRVQDYDEYEDSDDYDEPEEYDESGDYGDSHDVEDDEVQDDPDEYDAEEIDAGYDQADDADSDYTEDDYSDDAVSDDIDDDEESEDDEESLDTDEDTTVDDSADYEAAQDGSSQSALTEFESDEDSADSEESDGGADEYAYDETEEEYFLDDLEDDSWAPEIEFDETDDVLQTESENWGQNEVYEVVESVDDIIGTENVTMETSTGAPGSAQMPVVQRVVKQPGFARPSAKPASTESKPPAATQPPSSGTAKPRLKSSFGGRPVANSAVPWQAQIYAPFPANTWNEKQRAGKALWQLQHYCGGILIASDWVLTAAHCIDQEMVDSGYRIRLGSRDISRENGWTYKIDRIVRHSRYAEKPLPNNPNRYANDIALIRIADDGKAGPRDPERIQVIPLYRGPTLGGGTEVTVTGWGVTRAAPPAFPNAVLLKVDLRVMDGATCRGLRGYGPKKIGESVFCAANPAQSTCRGDSGGAVVLTNEKPTVVGIVSWGKTLCSGDGNPGVYTRISNFLPWIDQAMKLPPGKNALP